MTISIPDTLTIDYSEQYMMSIRLRPGGLSFSAYNPSEGQSFFFREVEFTRAIPYIASLKEVFFANDFLSWTYKRTHILSVSPQYMLVPDLIDVEAQGMALLSFGFTAPEKRALSDPLKEEKAIVLYSINEEVYEFCLRSLCNPAFIHHITPQLMLWIKSYSSGQPNGMYAVLHHRMMDVACFTEGKLLLVNTFPFDQREDLLYYILYVWQQTGMNQSADRLSLAGDAMLCSHVTESLRPYIRHIGRIEIPSEAYLLGGEILHAPMDLISLSVCAL
ncbi:MAG: DUF3822 family protein [Tannerellaceae bacterium]|jgi:hypothetical protein|nr:DUF3822 family protein [Tannerellaceae bacterium]